MGKQFFYRSWELQGRKVWRSDFWPVYQVLFPLLGRTRLFSSLLKEMECWSHQLREDGTLRNFPVPLFKSAFGLYYLLVRRLLFFGLGRLVGGLSGGEEYQFGFDRIGQGNELGLTLIMSKTVWEKSAASILLSFFSYTCIYIVWQIRKYI